MMTRYTKTRIYPRYFRIFQRYPPLLFFHGKKRHSIFSCMLFCELTHSIENTLSLHVSLFWGSAFVSLSAKCCSKFGATRPPASVPKNGRISHKAIKSPKRKSLIFASIFSLSLYQIKVYFYQKNILSTAMTSLRKIKNPVIMTTPVRISWIFPLTVLMSPPPIALLVTRRNPL